MKKIASITVEKIDQLPPATRHDVVLWLRHQADLMEQHGDAYTGNFYSSIFVSKDKEGVIL